MNDIDLSSLLCIIAFLVVFIGLAIYIILYSRKQSQATKTFAQHLGFKILPKPEASFLQRLRDLYQPTYVSKVSNLAIKVEGIGTIYLFDLMTSSPNRSSRSSGSGNIETRNVAILTPDLDLPPFILVNRMPTLGPLGNMLNDLIATGASWSGFTEWEMVPPDFNRRYILYVRDDPRNQTVFTSEALSRIAQSEGSLARGENDLLIFNTYQMRNNGKTDVAGLERHIQQARQMVETLRR